MSKTSDAVVIGFDLGHGETAVSWAHTGKNSVPNVIDLKGRGGRQHVTAVATLPPDTVLVGEDAVWARDVGELYLAFKSPHVDREEVRRPVQLFVGKIRQDIDEMRTVPAAKRVEWVFGAPSGWDRDVMSAYAQVLADAVAGSVTVVPESRAALLYARDAGEVRVDMDRLLGSVLVTDLGSSTTDFTAVIGRSARPFDYGTRLGAHLIDKSILDRVVERHHERDRLEEALDDTTERLKLELRCRQAKEQFFRTDPERFLRDAREMVVVTHPVFDAGGRTLVVIELSGADMEEVLDTPQRALGERSWRQAYRDDLVQAAEEMRVEPDVVLLTGGASRMRFVQEITTDVFGDDRVLLGAEPEVAIARGLALAGRTSIRAEGFRKDVRKLLAGNRIESLIADRLPALTDEIGKAAADGITDRHIVGVMRRWRRREIRTLNDVAAEVATALHDELTDPDNPTIAKVVVAWQNDLLPDINELTRPVCERWHVPPTSMALSPIRLSGSKDWQISVDVGPATSMLTGIAATVGVAVAGVLAMTLFGGGVAIIATTGPLGVIIAFVAGIWALFVGMEAAKEKVREVNLPVMVREMRGEDKLVEKLREKAAVNEAALAISLGRQFAADDNGDILRQLNQLVAKELDRLAEEAELLIS
ncbi:Hsp70 family protein [Nonomuraea insulae]|uniref:Hsp70 family protein n=1 Tax=Nonomuraea insulae TaxID=1616787 RepID=A0ABW1CC36_9ACTN